MWILKLVTHAGRETLHPCDHFEVTRYLPGTAVLRDFCEKTNSTEEEAAGIEVELIRRGKPGERSHREVLHVPRDGRVVYVMNGTGQIVDGYRWPPKNDDKKEATA